MGTRRMRSSSTTMSLAAFIITTIVMSSFVQPLASANNKYADALEKTLLFFEAQRSGYLPSNQRVKWRGNSGLQDGFAQGVDLVGGYYDAGDNMKFGLPMAFAVTILSWSAIEFQRELSAINQLSHALSSIKWGTDYFIKAHTHDNVLWGQVGIGQDDHSCWMRPEDMTTSRTAFKIDSENPGSDLAGETAAAMAAASIAFKPFNSSYSQLLLVHATQLFKFANTFRGKYDQSIENAKHFYPSAGYNDELLWAAAWLYRATSDEVYLHYLIDNSALLGGTGWAVEEFFSSNKYAGVQVLMSKLLMDNPGSPYTATLKQYQAKAEYFGCACMQKNGGYNVPLTPGGLLYYGDWSNLHYVSGATLLLVIYSSYLSSSNSQLTCPDGKFQAADVLKFAQSQADYILGSNPKSMSYLVGYGLQFPNHVHHRAASIPSKTLLTSSVGCIQGLEAWFVNPANDPSVLTGALVGGPDKLDQYHDQRGFYEQTEPATAGTAPLVGVFAKLAADSGSSGPALPHPMVTTRRYSVSKDPIQFVHSITNRWVSKGIDYYRHKVVVKNKSEKPITDLMLRLDNLSGPVYGLTPTKEKAVFTFPPWITVLKPGGDFTFVYVQEGPQARISVVKENRY